MSAQGARKRETRAGWAAATGFRPNLARDVGVLYAVGLCKALRTRDLERLSFPSRCVAVERLRKLFVAGLLDCHVRDLSHDNVYTLTERGREFVCQHADVVRRDLWVVRTLPAQLDHLFALNEVRVHMTLAARARSDVRLASFRPSWELMRERHSGVVGLVPDALIELEVEGQGARVVALEVDMSTESPAYLARRKLGRYRAALDADVPVYGHTDVTVFVVARGERRLRALASALADAGVVLGDLDALDEENVLDLAC